MWLNDKYPKFMKLLATLGFSKNHYKDIKKICNKNTNEFE